MSILVVGSVALDSVETPLGKVENALGGSATYFSAAASYFSEINLVAVVGEDFPKEHIKLLETKGVNLDGFKTIKGGKTFRWGGSYGKNLNEAKTHFTELNVFETFRPELPDHYRELDYVFLANIDPDLQLQVLDQVENPKAVICDTMNLWIDVKKESLLEVLAKVDIALINEGEAKMLTGESNLIKAGKLINKIGPEAVVIKKGSHGVMLLTESDYFVVPAYPLEEVFDPTGAGDSFAGGFVGYMAKEKGTPRDINILKKACVYGSCTASFCVEAFSLERHETLDIKQIERRFEEFIRFSCLK